VALKGVAVPAVDVAEGGRGKQLELDHEVMKQASNPALGIRVMISYGI